MSSSSKSKSKSKSKFESLPFSLLENDDDPLPLNIFDPSSPTMTPRVNVAQNNAKRRAFVASEQCEVVRQSPRLTSASEIENGGVKLLHAQGLRRLLRLSPNPGTLPRKTGKFESRMFDGKSPR
ncbi:DNA (cytosine-5)-methyltransferase CMT2 [Fagus crenata]